MEYSLYSNKSCARRRRPSMTLSMQEDRESEDDWDLSEASQPSCLYSMEAEDYCRSSYAMQSAHDREYPGTHSGFLLLIWRTEPAAGE